MDQTKLASKTGSAVRSKARSAIRSVAVSSLMLRKQLWIWPIIAAVLLGICGWWVSRSVENAMRERREEELSTILNADVGALRVWMKQQATYADLMADDPPLIPLAERLLEIGFKNGTSARELLQSPLQAELRAYLKPDMERCGFVGFFIVSPAGVVIAADQDTVIGQQISGYRLEFFDKVFLGKESVSKPYISTLLLADEHGELKPNLPTMMAAAPIRNAQNQPIAVLGLRIRPDVDFTRILQTARSGATGETYAFDDHGLLLSESRFDDQLKQIGLLTDTADHRSVLTLELRDPQVDMTQGLRPAERRPNQPLTKMAASAVRGDSGVDVVGYRDYRGVPVIGAWTWLKEYDLGVATEQDVAESFRPLYILRTAIWGMFGLLVAASAAIFVFSIFVAQANRKARSAAMEAQQLGQYKLDQKLGEGGMGVVYRAHHEMLQRPTAVKFLSLDKTNEQTLARFEREVQLTSKLTHPNTISIYDYGRTPEGVFYYAMEYLEGINLEDLVDRHGPIPEGRVIFILQQVCGSLAEAHAIGLIHRDIKPANIFLTERGGMFDFVKLLDFGLVKALDSRKDASLTTAGSLTGTPLYMPPEAIQHSSMDPRSDLYALGAVGYFLLTGTPVFDGHNVIEVLKKQVTDAPEAPSNRLGRPISPELEALLLKCLEKTPEARPSTASELSDELTKCHVSFTWARKEAQRWWQTNYPRPEIAAAKPETEKITVGATQVVAPTREDADVTTPR